jgi:putative N6-adenine-specific DNA methylase
VKRPPFIPVKQVAKARKAAPASPGAELSPKKSAKPTHKPLAANVPRAYDAWAIAAPGFEPLLESELRALGFADAAASTGGVTFSCDARGLARANLHSRLASRVVVRLAEFKALAFHELERAARRVEWGRMLAPGAPFRLRVTAKKSRLYHSDAIAERVADAIVRGVSGARFVAGSAKDEDEGELSADDAQSAAKGVGNDDAQAQLFVVRFDHDRCTISADASGELLHRRGYRQAVAKAPMRETIAAAMLAALKYSPAQPLVDPFCGSGTLLIEAAMIARRIAPGVCRAFAAERWPEVNAEAWRSERDAAKQAELPRAQAPIIGSDRDAGAIAAAIANAERAGVLADIEFVERPLSELTLPAVSGLLATNPPYGLRLSEKAPLRDLYARLGQMMRAQGKGWRVGMLSADKQLDGHTGLRFTERVRTSNGGIPVRIVEARS